MYSGPLESPVAVNWSDPDVTDNSASSVTLTSDVIKGTLLDPDFHIIRITASDLAGNRVSCNFVVTVEGALNSSISHLPRSSARINGIQHFDSFLVFTKSYTISDLFMLLFA